jgi:protein TonB
MNAATHPDYPVPTGVRPADRLGLPCSRRLVHLALILGVGFTMVMPSQISKTMEITLATFKSEKKPEKADFLAQENQQGSGTLDKKAIPKTTEVAPFQDSKQESHPAAGRPSRRSTRKRRRPPWPPGAARTRSSQDPRRPRPNRWPSRRRLRQLAAVQRDRQPRSRTGQRTAVRQAPAHPPPDAASTMRDKGAWYKEEWRKKVERIGNLNYPDEARRQQIYGSLRLMVSINRDGSLYEVLVLESSGQPLLDQAAQRIVRLAAPFAPFTGDLADIDRLEIIRTWRFARGDRLSSQ